MTWSETIVLALIYIGAGTVYCAVTVAGFWFGSRYVQAKRRKRS